MTQRKPFAASNEQVHAAGACDTNFKTDVAARSRATPGSPSFSSAEVGHDSFRIGGFIFLEFRELRGHCEVIFCQLLDGQVVGLVVGKTEIVF